MKTFNVDLSIVEMTSETEARWTGAQIEGAGITSHGTIDNDTIERWRVKAKTQRSAIAKVEKEIKGFVGVYIHTIDERL